MSCFMLILTWGGIIFVDILHRAKWFVVWKFAYMWLKCRSSHNVCESIEL